MITSKTEISNTIDWYSLTCDHAEYPSGATMRCVELDRGLYGYSAGVQFLDGRIELVNPDRPDMRTHIQYSGSALRASQDDWKVSPFAIVNYIVPGEDISRIDLAIDIKQGSLDILALADMVKERKVVSLAQKSMLISTLGEPGATLYLGAPSAKQRLRIYDKAAEQKIEDFEWTRIELQLRGKRAHAAKNMIRASGSLDPISMLVRGFADFPTSSDYSLAVGNKSLPISAPKKSEGDTRAWLLTTVVSSLAREAVRPGGQDFLKAFESSVEGQIEAEKKKIIDKA